MILEQIPTEFRCLFICVALTGIRLGELLSLKWKYVDIEAKRMQIAHSLWKRQLVSPKTTHGEHSIPIGDVLADSFAEHLKNSPFTSPEDFVFCKKEGKSLNPDVLRKDVLYPVLDRLNIPRPKGGG